MVEDIDPSILFHIIHYLIASKNHLWYDPQNKKLYTQSQFTNLFREGKIKHYIKSTAHPIILDEQKWKSLLDELTPAIRKIDDYTKKLINKHVMSKNEIFAQELLGIDPLLLLCMIKINKDFNNRTGNNVLWEEIWNKSFNTSNSSLHENEFNVEIPDVHDLRKLFLGIKTRKKNQVMYETLDVDIRDQNEYCNELGEKLEFIDGDVIVLQTPSEKSVWRCIDEEFVEDIDDEDTNVYAICGKDYFQNISVQDQ